MPNEIPPPAWKPRNREYHETTARWSSSSLKAFRQSPALAYRRYLAKDLPPTRPTPPMTLGTLVNLLLLEPAAVSKEVYVVDCSTKGTNLYKDAEKLYGKERTVVTIGEMETAEGIAAAVLNPQSRHAEVALELLTSEGGYSEYAYQWIDPATGVPCRMMLDRLSATGGDLGTVVELKTTVDPNPEAFQRQFFGMDYHCQAAFNSRGMAHLLGATDPGDFVRLRYFVVAVGNEPPHSVGVHLLSPETIDAGDAIVGRDLGRLAECLAGRSPWRSGWEDAEQIPFLRPPVWYRTPVDAEPVANTDAEGDGGDIALFDTNLAYQLT